MAKYYRRKYYRRRAFKKATANYFRAKMSTTDQILLDPEAMKLRKPSAPNRLLASYITDCQEWPLFNKIFYSMKVRGVLLEATPGVVAVTDSESPAVFAGTYMFGVVPMQSISDGFDALADCEGSMILNTQQKTRKYISFHGGVTSWIDIGVMSDQIKDVVSTNYQNGLPVNGGLTWSVRITFYITFKSPK